MPTIVLDHIDPKTPRPDIPAELWNRLDSIVKKWIYGTNSPDLLKTIFYRGATAQETWNQFKLFFKTINTSVMRIWKTSLTRPTLV